MKKVFKIFRIKSDYPGVYTPTYELVQASEFGPLQARKTKEECEQAINSVGALGISYVILETIERETL